MKWIAFICNYSEKNQKRIIQKVEERVWKFPFNYSHYWGDVKSEDHLSIRIEETNKNQIDKFLKKNKIKYTLQNYNERKEIRESYCYGSKFALNFGIKDSKKRVKRLHTIHGFYNSLGLDYNQEIKDYFTLSKIYCRYMLKNWFLKQWKRVKL